MDKLHKYSFALLLIVTIVDPGNIIFNLKEFFFVLTFISGLVILNFKINYWVLVGSLFFSIAIPLLWFLIGLISNYSFSIEYGIMYLKSFIFFLLINICMNPGVNYIKLFSRTTLILIPIVLTIFYFVYFLGDFAFLLNFKETFTLSRRAFGDFILDPVVFYKTSPLLIFGFSYLCNQFSEKKTITSFILALACLFVLVLSGTRANIISSFIIIIFFFYQNFFSKSVFKKISFWILSLSSLITFIIPFAVSYFFDKDEESNSKKLSYIDSYLELWSNDVISLIFGQGIGGGLNTAGGGTKYLIEPTYFEIVRMFGLIGGCVFVLFLVIPILLFIISKSNSVSKQNTYLLLSYILYIMIEIPSNPLLISSTGMLVMVVVYSAALKSFSLHE